jgi:hypothetical protein
MFSFPTMLAVSAVDVVPASLSTPLPESDLSLPFTHSQTDLPAAPAADFAASFPTAATLELPDP